MFQHYNQNKQSFENIQDQSFPVRISQLYTFFDSKDHNENTNEIVIPAGELQALISVRLDNFVL